MNVAQPLFWFHVEPVLTVLRRFDVKAALASADALRAPAGTPSPQRKDEVTEVTGFGQPLSWGSNPTDDLSTSQESLDIVKLRGELREGLRRLERRLAQDMREPHVRNILHPLIIHADERMMTATRGRAAAWTQLQLEFLGFDDGGVQFYTKLEELLGQPDTPLLVLEAYYYCLRDGFSGLYADNPARIEDYKERLDKRLESKVSSAEPEASDEAQVELLEFPYRYYLRAGAVVLGLGLGLFLLGWMHGA